MKDNCLDIGTIQAFLDCELSHDEVSRVSGHIAACDSCASMLAAAEDESAFVFSALDGEMNSLVPTQRLWNRINEGIGVERHHASFGQRLWAMLSAAFLSPSLAISASLVVVIGIVAFVMLDRGPNSNDLASSTPAPQIAQRVPVPTVSTQEIEQTPTSATPTTAAPTRRSDVYLASYRPEPRRQGTNLTAQPQRATPAVAYMPGEASYVKTIATLSKTVDEKKDGLMGASERVAFEKDMALVNDSISKLRQEVKRNPANESAKQVLYSSYQNKIDLLNSVAQKEELIASIK